MLVREIHAASFGGARVYILRVDEKALKRVLDRNHVRRGLRISDSLYGTTCALAVFRFEANVFVQWL